MERRRADLLLALDEHAHVARQFALRLQPRFHRDRMRDRARLVVGTAAPVEAAVTLDGFERIGGPTLDESRGLNIVVRVEQHGRSGGPRVHPFTENVRMRTLDPGQSHPFQPAALEQRGGRLRARPHVGGVLGRGADALDPHQRFELLTGRGHRGVDVCEDGFEVSHQPRC